MYVWHVCGLRVWTDTITRKSLVPWAPTQLVIWDQRLHLFPSLVPPALPLRRPVPFTLPKGRGLSFSALAGLCVHSEGFLRGGFQKLRKDPLAGVFPRAERLRRRPISRGQGLPRPYLAFSFPFLPSQGASRWSGEPVGHGAKSQAQWRVLVGRERVLCERGCF